jgi:alpha-L-fucosidase
MKLKILTMGLLTIFNYSYATSPEETGNGIDAYRTPQITQEYLNRVDAKFKPYMKAQPEAIEAWQDDRFGMFIHWDHSSQAPVSMSWGRKGPRPRHRTDGKVETGLDEQAYNDLAKTFNPIKFDAAQWMQLVEDSGAKYVVFTAKHHAGFSMFDSAVTDFDIMNTPFSRDVIKELVQEAHKRGIKFHFYYSQPDWYHKDFSDKETTERYVREFLYPQLKELVTQYGKIDGIWFDGLGLHPDTWHSPELIAMLRKIQPHLLFNGRYAADDWHLGDYDGPEQRIGRFQVNRAWETCGVIGGGWGWSGDSDAMHFNDAIKQLSRVAVRGGNLLLNTGPNGLGEITASHKLRFRDIGQWLKKYGDAIYGTRGGPYIDGPWGGATYKKRTVYLHISGHVTGNLVLPDLPVKVTDIKSLTGGKVSMQQQGGSLQLELPIQQDGPVRIIELTLAQDAKDIVPIETVGEVQHFDSTVSASSNKNKQYSAQNLITQDLKTFTEGIMINKPWIPSKTDDKPWLQLNYSENKLIKMIEITNGIYGHPPGKEQSYKVSLKTNGHWKIVDQGSELRVSTGIVFDKAIKANALRLDFSGNEGMKIYAVKAYNDLQNTE